MEHLIQPIPGPQCCRMQSRWHCSAGKKCMHCRALTSLSHTPSFTRNFVTHIHIHIHTYVRTYIHTYMHTIFSHTFTHSLSPPPLSFLPSPSPLQPLKLSIGRSWLVGLSGPLISVIFFRMFDIGLFYLLVSPWVHFRTSFGSNMDEPHQVRSMKASCNWSVQTTTVSISEGVINKWWTCEWHMKTRRSGKKKTELSCWSVPAMLATAWELRRWGVVRVYGKYSIWLKHEENTGTMYQYVAFGCIFYSSHVF